MDLMTNYDKWQTRPLVREGAPYQQTRNRLTVIKIWSKALDGCFIPRQTGRLIVGRNMTLDASTIGQDGVFHGFRTRNYITSMFVARLDQTGDWIGELSLVDQKLVAEEKLEGDLWRLSV
jgi:hypothetical protein